MSSLYEKIESELELVSGSDKNTNYFQFIEKVNNIIDLYPEDAVKVGLDLILKSYHNKPWGAISLDNTQFNKIGQHYRAWYIQFDGKAVHNTLAYTMKQRRIYRINNEGVCQEITPDKATLNVEGEVIDERVYISRGGIINGDYIHKCYIKDQTNDYNIKDPIKLPVSTIEYEDSPNIVFFVDHREPKLKALTEFYNVKIEHDDKIKFNVRTFKKLKYGVKF